MSGREPCGRLLAWARCVLEPAVVARVVEPCVADVRHEQAAKLAQGDRAAARRVALGGVLTVLGLVLRLRLERRIGDACRVSWWALLPATGTALLASIAMSVARPGAARAQLVFVALGILGAALVATTSPRTLRRATWPAAVAVVGALAAVLAVDGAHEHATRRWLPVGPLSVHVAALATPAFVLATSGLLTGHGRWVGGTFVALSLALVALQPDAASTMVLAAAAVASAWTALPRARRGGVAALAGWALAATSVAVVVMPHFRADPGSPDGGLSLLLARGTPWLIGGLVGLSVTLLVSVRLALRSASGAEAEPFERALGAGLVAAMAAQPVAAVVAHDGVHLISHGGSGVVASFLALGLLLAHARGGPLAKRPGRLARPRP